ncbi:pseudouridine synthase [Treponema pectinovorum]|uniref:pseudouridine synthase n=1 Tax=Treponema pectinovorum TaxID=164 RepID=UPI0011CC0980|nr:pseudouridine synthase [Treponema pectinovorum]
MKKNLRGLNLQDKPKEKQRLQAFLAHCGVASRRSSEKIIAEGRVTVNGDVVTELGTKVSVDDEICVDGKKVNLENRKIYILLNKPSGLVCSQSDEKGRPVAVDLLKQKYSQRLYNVGRLDMFSRGAVIFTNDGDFAAKLSHPSSEIEKEYLVETSYPLPEGLDQRFLKGIRVEGIFYKAKQTKIINTHKMKVILIEGKNREIRRVFADAGSSIRSLQRVRIGNLGLGNLKEGEFRELTDFEVKGLLSLCKN